MDEKTILVIDADEQVQQQIQEALADRPCRFIFVSEASEAIVQFMTEMPNAVILSLEMPDGDGVETLQNIREFDENIPIIVMTGAPTKEKLIAAKRAKAVDILLKPPDFSRICGKLCNHLWLSEELLKNTEGAEGGAPAQPAAPPEPEPFVEAVPKGAEVLNINDTIAGMRVARTLVLNDVVYADKGMVLTEVVIKRLTRMGVPEICVYIDAALKKRVEQRKKAAAAAPVMGAQTGSGEKVFSKVKRNAVRADANEPAVVRRTLKDGNVVEVEGFIVDISGGGCALLTADPLDKSEEIILNFTLDEGKFLMKDVRGVVRHSIRRFGSEELPQRSGIYFNSLTEKFRENLITVVFKLERDNKKKEDDLRARFGYGPKKRRPPSAT
ncbi:MAG: response regulator [bacterium]